MTDNLDAEILALSQKYTLDEMIYALASVLEVIYKLDNSKCASVGFFLIDMILLKNGKTQISNITARDNVKPELLTRVKYLLEGSKIKFTQNISHQIN